MITPLFIVIIFIYSVLITILFISLVFIRVILTRLQTSCLLIGIAFVHLCSETLFLVTHLVKHCGILTFFVFFVNLFFLTLYMLLLQLIDNVFLLVPPLLVFQVVHVKFILKVVNVCVLFNVHRVETFEFSFKSLILFLVFWFHILKSLHTLVCSLQFLAPSGNLVLEL